MKYAHISQKYGANASQICPKHKEKQGKMLDTIFSEKARGQKPSASEGKLGSTGEARRPFFEHQTAGKKVAERHEEKVKSTQETTDTETRLEKKQSSEV